MPKNHSFCLQASFVIRGSCSVWPNLAKFRHFGQSDKSLANFLMVYFLVGKMLSLRCQICDIIGLIFIVAIGQILKNNITIW